MLAATPEAWRRLFSLLHPVATTMYLTVLGMYFPRQRSAGMWQQVMLLP